MRLVEAHSLNVFHLCDVEVLLRGYLLTIDDNIVEVDVLDVELVVPTIELRAIGAILRHVDIVVGNP